MPKEESAGVIIYRKGKYLLLHYCKQGNYKGHWGLPKGTYEPGVDPKQKILKDIREMTGLKSLFIVPGFKEKVNYFYKKEGKTIYKEVIYFLAETSNEEVKLSEDYDQYEWLSFGDAMSRIQFKNGQNVLRKAENFMHKDY